MFRSTHSPTDARTLDLRRPDALAEVFDAHAAQLLRYAIHLIGDPAEAEDLVQETFVAAIEAAERFDASRPLAPWLRGILANQAKRRMRTGGRRIDVERLLERSTTAAFTETLDKEQDGALAKAIDQLDEPYRQVVLLRLRHGMQPSDIAHVLGVSPGAVRVRLHRGIQKTRRLLPAGLALPLAQWQTPARGLEAVRDAVLHHAHLSALAGATGGLLGGLVVKKTLAALTVACALVAALWWTTWRTDDDSTPTDQGTPALIQGTTDGAEKVATPGLRGQGSADVRAAEPDLVPASGPTALLAGRVVNAEDNEPVPAATLTLFPARRTTVAALRHAHPGLLTQFRDGRLRALAPTAVVVDGPHATAQFRDAARDVFTAPRADDAPLARTHSRADGGFELRMPQQPGVLVVTHPNHGRAQLAVVGPATDYEIRLSPVRRFAATVHDPAGKPVVGMQVLISSTRTYPPAGHVQKPLHRVDVPQAAALTTTDANGAFDVRVSAKWVRVYSRAPGLRIEKKEDMAGATARGFIWMTYAVGGGEAPATLVARPTATLRVFDADTGDAIERFHVRGQTLRDSLRWRGRFFAPKGLWTLFDADADGRRRAGDASAVFRVWAPGYRPGRAAFENLQTAGIVDVALTRGDTSGIDGVVLASGDPVAGATVSLATPAMYWQVGRTTRVAGTTSDAEGAFRLEAPKGRYIVEVRRGEVVHARIVATPAQRDLVIDLDALASLEVMVVDSEGTPKVDHVVGLHGADGRSGRAYTDAGGRLVFDRLAPGTYTVHAPQVSTKGSFAGGLTNKADLAEGERGSVTLTIPLLAEDVLARIVPDAPTDFTHWHARGARETAWVAMRADGTVPIPLQAGEWRLELKAPDKRRFFVRVPDKATASFDVPLTLDGPSYEGIITDPDGHPWPGIRIIGKPGGEPVAQAWGSCITDDEGRFRLVGAGDIAHTLEFQDHANRNRARFQGILYRCAKPPSPRGTPLNFRLSYGADKGLGGKRVHLQGHARREDGAAYASVRMLLECEYPDPHGVLVTFPKTASVRASDVGRFDMKAPPAPRYQIRFYDPKTWTIQLSSEWIVPKGTTEATRDFVVP